MGEDLRPPPEERHRRAIRVMWLLLAPPAAVAGVLVGMVWLSGKSPVLLWAALAICVLTMAVSIPVPRSFILGGTGRTRHV